MPKAPPTLPEVTRNWSTDFETASANWPWTTCPLARRVERGAPARPIEIRQPRAARLDWR